MVARLAGAPVVDVDPLMVDIECAIAELSHTVDMYADAKKKFKALNKQLKYRIKVELRTATIT